MSAIAAVPRGLSYDLVIATRNRAEALSLSLPLIIDQSVPPRRLIVVDSSDDPAPAAAAVAAATSGWGGEVRLHHVAPGLTRQRNIGLGEVTAPIVFFFDDDALVHPGAAEDILSVYARDTDKQIAGVAAAEAKVPPGGSLPDQAWCMSDTHRKEARRRGLRHRLERRLTALKPSIFLGATLNSRHEVPAWLDAFDAVPVEYMTGFRMTFRTAAIRAAGFDETLLGYGLDEDIDASFSAMASGLVVAARRARVYHHRALGGRGSAFELGRMQIFHRAHVLLKHAAGPLGSPRLVRRVWRLHLLFTALKIASLVPRAIRPYGRAQLAGVLSGARAAFALRAQQTARALPIAPERLQDRDISAT